MATEVGMPCWQGGPWLAVHAALYHMHLAPPLPPTGAPCCESSAGLPCSATSADGCLYTACELSYHH